VVTILDGDGKVVARGMVAVVGAQFPAQIFSYSVQPSNAASEK